VSTFIHVLTEANPMFAQTAAFVYLTATILCLAAMPAEAQQYPTKSVRIITGGSGSFHDIVSRHLGQRLSERWGQPVVVENHPGAGLTIASGIVARSTPDGYTLLMADRTSVAAAPNLYKSLPYDPVKDLSPITLVALAPLMLVAHPSVPAATLREFIEYAKRQPGGMNVTSAGPGTAVHMTGELLNHAAGINLVSVQYNGGAAATMAVLSGEVKAGFSLVPNVLPHVTAGKLKGYAITGGKRFAGAPDVPTANEAGLVGFESEQWIGIFAPARTPAGVIEKLNRDIVQILRTPQMQAVLIGQGAAPAPGTPGEFAEFIRTETLKLKRIIDLTGMRAN
jgi:tripartite-type tricarboxylate transporter receptor subunit TctC